MLLQELALGWGWVVESKIGTGLRGYILVRPDQGVNDITRLGIAKEHQGQGLAKLLLRCVIGLFNQDIILTVRKDNAPAIQLYTRFGFQITGHVHEASWLMRRSIHNELRG